MKKPNIYKPPINHKVNNNKKAYYSYLETDNIEAGNYQDEEPMDTLNRLINSGSYIFNKKVQIITNTKTYNTKIAGKIGDRIITIDGDDIYLSNIKKIIEK